MGRNRDRIGAVATVLLYLPLAVAAFVGVACMVSIIAVGAFAARLRHVVAEALSRGRDTSNVAGFVGQ